MTLVTIKKFAETTGYSEEAIRQKLKKGIWRLREHAFKAPDGRVLLNPKKIEQWATQELLNEDL